MFLFLVSPYASALNLTLTSSIQPGTWLADGNGVTGAFDIASITNIKNINSAFANFYFYGDFDGYQLKSTTTGGWSFNHNDCNVLNVCDTYWERDVTYNYEDDHETAFVSLVAQSAVASSPTSDQGTTYMGQTPYFHQWHWEGSIQEWDDYGKDIVYKHELKNEGNFIATIMLDQLSIHLLEMDKILPFQIVSVNGDFMVNAATLDVNYTPFPEPCTFLLMTAGMGFLWVRRKRM
jgi:hypothetical protein